jgi:DHA1 family bicyclomycin/chloramphenicol resistance-like MFS transporter
MERALHALRAHAPVARAIGLNVLRTRRQNFFLILSLGILNALTPFTIDMYLPAFPYIAKELGVQVSQMALTVSVYFIGFSLGQIVYGPLLDRFGRKLPLFGGLLLYILGSLGCAAAHSLNTLLFFRFLTALGGCASGVGATAMVRDYFPPEASAKIFSMLMLVLSVSPLFAPTVGSLMMAFTGWRTIFLILAGFGVADLLLVASLPRGYTPNTDEKLHPARIYQNFKAVLSNRRFVTAVLAGSFSFAGLFVYVAASPSIFMDYFHLTPKMYGGVFALLAVGMIGGGQLNHFLVKKWGSAKTLRLAITVQVICGAVFFIGGLFDLFGLVSTIVCLFIILVGAGISYPNAVALALEPFSTGLGSASSLLGFLQLGIGSVVSACVGLVSVRGYLPTAAISVSSCIALGIVLVSD